MSVEGLQDLSLAFGNLFKKVIPEQQGLVVRRISLEGYSGIVAKTPVDTGRARANWSVTINKPRGTWLETTDKQPKGSPPALLAAAVNAANEAKPADTIYVTNSLPYIIPLEEGHSKQGAHMVELTVNELKRHYGI